MKVDSHKTQFCLCQKYRRFEKTKKKQKKTSEASEMSTCFFLEIMSRSNYLLIFFFTSPTFKAFHILPDEFLTSKGIISGSRSRTLMNFQRLEEKEKKTGLPFLLDFWVIRLDSVRRAKLRNRFSVCVFFLLVSLRVSLSADTMT